MKKFLGTLGMLSCFAFGAVFADTLEVMSTAAIERGKIPEKAKQTATKTIGGMNGDVTENNGGRKYAKALATFKETIDIEMKSVERGVDAIKDVIDIAKHVGEDMDAPYAERDEGRRIELQLRPMHYALYEGTQNIKKVKKAISKLNGSKDKKALKLFKEILENIGDVKKEMEIVIADSKLLRETDSSNITNPKLKEKIEIASRLFNEEHDAKNKKVESVQKAISAIGAACKALETVEIEASDSEIYKAIQEKETSSNIGGLGVMVKIAGNFMAHLKESTKKTVTDYKSALPSMEVAEGSKKESEEKASEEKEEEEEQKEEEEQEKDA